MMEFPINLFKDAVVLPPEPYTLPRDWMDIRTEMQSKVCWEHGNRLHDGELGNFDFDAYFSAGDTLLDTGNILFYAKNIRRWPADQTEAQWKMYGALQALNVQRDSIWQLARCFGIIKVSVADKIFTEIAQWRVSVAGHPSKHKSTNIKGETFLAGLGSQPGNFKIGTYEKGKKFLPREFDVPELVRKQEAACFEYMKLAHNALVDDPAFDTDDWEKYPCESDKAPTK